MQDSDAVSAFMTLDTDWGITGRGGRYPRTGIIILHCGGIEDLGQQGETLTGWRRRVQFAGWVRRRRVLCNRVGGRAWMEPCKSGRWRNVLTRAGPTSFEDRGLPLLLAIKGRHKVGDAQRGTGGSAGHHSL